MAGSKLYNVKHGGALFNGDTGKASIVLIILAAIIIIVLIMFYIIWLVRYYNYSSKILFRSPKALDKSDTYSVNKDSTAEHSYAFWIYYKDVSIITENTLILCRSNTWNPTTGTGVSGAAGLTSSTPTGGDVDPSMVIASVKGTNRLFVSVPIRAVGNEGIKSSGVNLINMFPTDTNYASNAYVTAVIDYVPIQQWVHIAVVCRSTEFTIYMNGDVYAVKTSVDKLRQTPEGVGARKIPRQFVNGSGSVVVGDTKNSNAIMNRLTYFNYAISQADVVSAYNKGPTAWSLFSWLSIGNMRLQSPITFEPEKDETQ